MKKLVLIAIALVTLQAVAQERKERPDNRERAERFKDMSPEDMATLHTKKMVLHLDLNESQQKEIQKINLENAIQRKNMMEARKARMESNAEKPSKEERLEMMNKGLDHKIAMKAKMKQILNADQYEKWSKSQERMGDKQKEMHSKEKMKKG